jgi:prolyl 4-hydroxylase
MFIAPPPIQPTKIYAGAIAEYENVWDDCKKLIEGIENEYEKGSVEFTPAPTVDLQKASLRTNSYLLVDKFAQSNDFYRELNNRYFLTVLAATESYREIFHLDPLHHAEAYQLLKYQTGEEYKAHFDGTTQSRRSVSPILYLNDDYEGGELEFVHFDLKIKPKAGALYLFPANYAYSHIAHPVIEGTKYALVTWLHDWAE